MVRDHQHRGCEAVGPGAAQRDLLRPFVTAAKAEFSNSRNALQQKWASYVKGDPTRQEVLEVALDWVAAAKGKDIDGYLALHRHDTSIDELKTYFTTVIDWAGSVFTRAPDKEMHGLEWNRLLEEYHAKAYNPTAVDSPVEKSCGPVPAVHDARGIYEYVLSGESKPNLLNVRVLDRRARNASPMNARRRPRRPRACPTARCAPQARTRTGRRSTRSRRWTPTTSPLGRGAGRRTQTTARCCASRIIAARATGRPDDCA